jgi:hypothetical protein
MEGLVSYWVENAAALGAIAACIGVLVTLIVFVAQVAMTLRAAQVEARRMLVARVLDHVDRAARAHTLYPLSLLWTRAESELVMTLPRLTLDLGNRERAIAYWVARQVQHMQAELDPKRILRINYGVAFQLTEWHQGNVKTSWFVDANRRDPFEAGYVAPLKIQRAKRRRAAAAFLITVAAWAFVPQLARKAINPGS